MSDLPVGGYTVIIVGKAWTPDMEALGHTTPVVRRQRLGRKGAELKKKKKAKTSRPTPVTLSRPTPSWGKSIETHNPRREHCTLSHWTTDLYPEEPAFAVLTEAVQ